MRNVQKIPRPVRRGLKAIVPDQVRSRLHDWDYHAGQIAATYQHHLNLAPPSLPARVRAFLDTMHRLIGRKRILCYPDLPGPGSVFYKLCLHQGYSVTDDPTSSFDAVIKWKNATYSPNDSTLAAIASEVRVLNFDVTDISKSEVIRAFDEAFGYKLGVDPEVYEGPILRKSEKNAAHDGTVLQGPIKAPGDDYVYQRLINNTSDGLAVDLRVPIFGEDIPFVRVKYRPISKRFDHAGRSQVNDDVNPTDEVLSPTEQSRILALCRAMGLNYGELDVLRDRDTGRIYVVDVNNTPTGPTFVSADRETIKWCFDVMAQSLDDCLFRYAKANSHVELDS